MPGRDDRHYLWVGRASGFVITMLGVLYAVFLIDSVLYTFLLTETLATYVGISVLGGIVWPRANRWGALASLLGSLATNFALYAVTGQRLDHWDPNVFLASLAIGIIALVVVSLMTAPEPAGPDSTISSSVCRRRAMRHRGDAAQPAAPRQPAAACAARGRRARVERVPGRSRRLCRRLADRVPGGHRHRRHAEDVIARPRVDVLVTVASSRGSEASDREMRAGTKPPEVHRNA